MQIKKTLKQIKFENFKIIRVLKLLNLTIDGFQKIKNTHASEISAENLAIWINEG